MKKQNLFLSLIFISITTFSQEQPALPYNKKHLDSLFGLMQKNNQPFILGSPKNYINPNQVYSSRPQTFEELNPGATVINKTISGTIYNMPIDNMAVLVPYMKQIEKMPGINQKFRITPENMPNPLYPKRRNIK